MDIEAYDGFYIVGTPDNPIAKLKIRDDYPHTYAFAVDQNTVALGYGPPEPQEHDEFLQIIIHTSGDVAIRRDLCATLPLFYGICRDKFVVSNEYQCVAQAMTALTLNRAELFRSLVPHADSYATLWDEINILGEYAILEFDSTSHTAHVRHPRQRSWLASGEAPGVDPLQFHAVLVEHLENFLDKWVVHDTFAFEISGGLDSATLPLYFAKNRFRFVTRPLMGAMIYPGEFGVSQNEKLRYLTDLTGSSLVPHMLDPAVDYPLSRMLRANEHVHHYSFDDIYYEAVDCLMTRMAVRGVRLLARGSGGDELFEHTMSTELLLAHGQAERERRRSLVYPPFFTDKMRSMYIAMTPDTSRYPLPLLGLSFHGGQVGHNNSCIAHGIWPISPFANLALYEFCQGLPIALRVHKNILRIFHHTQKFPEIIYSSERQNEHFGVFFAMSLTSGIYDKVVKELAAHAVTIELGLVDAAALFRTYHSCKQEKHQHTDRWLFYIFSWISTEINLQVARRQYGQRMIGGSF